MPGPISVPVTTRVNQVWSARAVNDSVVSTLLLMNQDLVNTVNVGSDPTSIVVPIAPNGSLSVDPKSNWYVQGLVAGAAPLVIVPNGQSNFQGLTQAAGALALPSVRSPNFNLSNPLASPSPSWGILQNGLAYFFGLVLTGGTFTGPDYIINQQGFFGYTGTPGVNKLAVSMVPGANATDPFGNIAFIGFSTYQAFGAGYLQVNQFQTLTSVTYGTDMANWTSNISTSTITPTVVGTTITSFVNFINGPFQLDAWNTPALLNGWAPGGGGITGGVRYRKSVQQTVQVEFDLVNAGAPVGNSVFCTLPTPSYQVATGFRNYGCVGVNNVVNPASSPPWINVATNGNLILTGITAADAGKEMFGQFEYPLT